LAGGPLPHASRPFSGREVSIFQIFSIRLPFLEFLFFIPFLKETPKAKGKLLGWSPDPPERIGLAWGCFENAIYLKSKVPISL
jgi:hypothetical protein